MYRNHDNRLSVVNGQRIAHGHTVRDDAKRLRLAGILKRMNLVVKPATALASEDKPIERKYRQCYNKLRLAKYNTSPNATKAANNIRARKDASGDDGSDVIVVKRKRSFDNSLNNNNLNNNMHGKETTLHLEAKRQRIEPASLKQDIEYTDVYACVKSPADGLKLRFTKVSSGAGGA